MSQLLDRSVSARTGVVSSTHIEDDQVIVQSFTPTSVEKEIIEHCAKVRHVNTSNSGMQWVAGTPMQMYIYRKRDWQKNHSKYMSWERYQTAKLNDPQYKKLRYDGKRGGIKRL